MRYIDKSVRQHDFDKYSRAYLKEARQSDGTFVPPINNDSSYKDGFSNRKYRAPLTGDGWQQILLEEQDGLCCYCMKRLKADEVSVEHLVPENFDNNQNPQAEYAYYARFAPRIASYVELAEDFSKRRFMSDADIDAVRRMPHLIAHSNLFAACQHKKNSKEVGCSCNSHRGNIPIMPLMLMNNVGSLVKYEENGDVSLLLQDVRESERILSALDINCDNLRQIRRLWYLAKHQQVPVLDITSMNDGQRVEFILGLFGVEEIFDLDVDYQKYCRFGNEGEDAYWKLFLQYDWFYHIY